jgi:hypothetical protein
MANSKNRKIKNFLLQPGTQIRYVIIIAIWGVLGLSYLQGMLIQSMGSLALQYANELNVMSSESSNGLENAIQNAWLIFGFSVVLNCLLAAGFGIYMTHRFLGPAVAIQSLVKDLREGRYNSRKSLRKGDELMELMEEVNGLAEALEKKYGTSN